MSLKKGEILGQYRVEEEIGRGGMGTVYRAYQASLDRFVAVKVMHEFFSDSPAIRERFSREAATVARLRHPNIVSVFDFGEQEGMPYIVTELIDGSTLSPRLGAPIPPDDAVELLRPLADALDYAHRQGVVHRDVKPANILIGSDGAPVLTDFGLSWIAGSLPRLTHTGAPVGTPEYMAPELAVGGMTEESADCYALGVIAYEMLTGRVPFTGPAPLVVLMDQVRRPVPRPSSINPGLSEAIEAVLERALEKDPTDRYGTAVEFVRGLEAAIDSPPRPAITDARPTSPAPLVRPDHGVENTIAKAAGIDKPAEIRPYVAFSDSTLDADGEALRAGLGLQASLDALQHPVVLLPLASAGLGLVYVLALAPVSGYGLVAAGLTVVMLAVAAVGLLRSYPEAYETAELRKSERSEAERRQRERDNMDALSASLREGFAANGVNEGVRVLTRLEGEYRQSLAFAERTDTRDPVSMRLVNPMLLHTYRRGLSLLGDALSLSSAASANEVANLKAELAGLEVAIESEQAESRSNLLRTRAEEHRRRLRKLDDGLLRRDELLFGAEQCEAALQRTRIDIAAIRTGSSQASVDAVLTSLQRTIDQVRSVQDEIRRLGYS